MTSDFTIPADAVALVADLRGRLRLTQAQLASAAGLDQSRVSRFEKGEISSPTDVFRLLNALAERGAPDAAKYALFLRRKWFRLDRPAFRNPQLSSLESADEALRQIDDFLAPDHKIEASWPLVRHVESQREALKGAAAYLQSLSHQIAFIGRIEVGKSTAVSVMFELLGQAGDGKTLVDRVVLETGSGRTTICEVHLRPAPVYGLRVEAQSDAQMRALVRDFCADIWLKHRDAKTDTDAAVSFSEELGRAIRNMAGIAVQRERQPDGKRLSRDRAAELCAECSSQDEFRARVLDLMQLGQRTRTEMWFEPTPGRHPLVWMADTFKGVNNGRLNDVPLPNRIDLLIPDFAKDLAPLDVTLIDTKGVDDNAVRPDLDKRLADPRTLVVLCSRFGDAPGQTAQELIEHMQKSRPEPLEEQRVIILALARPGEALQVKDDTGAFAENDEEGYDLKREQIERSLGKDRLAGVPIHFFNAFSEDPTRIRAKLLERLLLVRQDYALRIVGTQNSLCETVEHLIQNHEQIALGLAIDEVAKRLRIFLEDRSGEGLGPQAGHAYDEVMEQVDRVRYASTLWASMRRDGDYDGFDIYHHLGNGAAKNVRARSKDWFTALKSQVDIMKGEPSLGEASRVLGQVDASIQQWLSALTEAARTAGGEIYREELQKDPGLWADCANQWGRGSGFKLRVKDRLKAWFEHRADISGQLDEVLKLRFADTVVRPLEFLVTSKGTKSI